MDVHHSHLRVCWSTENIDYASVSCSSLKSVNSLIKQTNLCGIVEKCYWTVCAILSVWIRVSFWKTYFTHMHGSCFLFLVLFVCLFVVSKQGECPPIDPESILCVSQTNPCSNDMDCGGVEKCCWTGCSPVCMEPG